MMTPLRCCYISILLFILPAVACLMNRRMSFVTFPQHPKQATHISHMGRSIFDRTRPLSLGIDPSDAIQHLSQHVFSSSHHSPTIDHLLTTDLLSTMLSTSTNVKTNVIIPNHSLPPLPETMQSFSLPPTAPNALITPDIKSMSDYTKSIQETTIIPDMPSFPGGTPRSGNPFLAESFRDLYGAPKAPPMTGGPDGLITTNPDGSVVVIPPKEFDLIGRYADLLNRIPLAATIYALVDFFIINSNEDVAISELLAEEDENGELDERRVEAIMDVEGSVVMTRFYGLVITVFLTVVVSSLVYHPVPFGELGG